MLGFSKRILDGNNTASPVSRRGRMPVSPAKESGIRHLITLWSVSLVRRKERKLLHWLKVVFVDRGPIAAI